MRQWALCPPARLPQALAAIELGEHLDLEFPRPEAEAFARALVEERAVGLQAEFAHPPEQRVVRVAPGRTQDIGGFRSPPDRNDQHAEPVRLEFLGKRALLLQPPADEVPARVDRPALVDGAAPLSAEVARQEESPFPEEFKPDRKSTRLNSSH